ncbi:PQQ-dependent dehydrogenase, methanol/ethanol family [Mesorhizobium sp. DCY119]|uniref:PQQ-dependent dehydrogenase, methanol/ethanol family n=2 Tax=Mesorhizobium sp. DCY119 TaxID=2108445 RepID=UPI000E6BFAD5|nr:PQQ-dependent dehydrogenase, methanol/ethanol family [Mesorhizobium sp. DCY119]RJG46263.1 PQQ-dependent dehydrogenase, methanol/ethanol family [Mesorhizobium sp. DCY119]
MKTRQFLVAMAAVLPATAFAQTADELKADATTPGDVLTYGMGYGLQRYSPLDQVNKDTVGKLRPIWNITISSDRGEEAQPLVYNGVIYTTTHNATMAIDAATGRQLWRAAFEYPPETNALACCGIVNRGAALFDGRLYRTTLDAHVIALDIQDGKELWRSKATEIADGYSFTVAPLVANGVVITGISGGEYGTRGFIDGWDAATGKQLWRRFTIPEPTEKGGDTWPGDTWKRGGGPAWLTGSYDPDLDLVYWGTGNGGPWNPNVRKGDNLYICSVLAIRPKTGEIVWYYQFSPNDPFDYDGTNELVQADLTIEGQAKKVIMQANRNGFFYVIDRENGKLLTASPFVKDINWATGINLDSGRPIESEEMKKMRETGAPFVVVPSALGGKNWPHMAFNPDTGLVYANTLNATMHYEPIAPEYRQGTFYLGINFLGVNWPDKERGYLKAIDPLTGKAKWERPYEIPSFSSVLTTKGGLVFSGDMTGMFSAYDADSGKKLWDYQTGSGIIGQPITWESGGKQYVTVSSGIGGVYALFVGDERLANVPTGGSLTTFALGD